MRQRFHNLNTTTLPALIIPRSVDHLLVAEGARVALEGFTSYPNQQRQGKCIIVGSRRRHPSNNPPF